MSTEAEISHEFGQVALGATAVVTQMTDPEQSAAFPVEHRKAEITKAERAFTLAHDKALRELGAIRDARHAEAATVYKQDPPDPERTARLLEAGQLAQTVTTKTEARNKLIPMGLALAARGDWRGAEVQMVAATLAGLPSQALQNAVEVAKDRDPAFKTRARAIDMYGAADKAWSEQWVAISRVKARLALQAGRKADAVSSSISVKLAEARMAQEEGREYRGQVGVVGSEFLPEATGRISNGGNRMVDPSPGLGPAGGTRYVAVSRTEPSRERPLSPKLGRKAR
jgi:hypothetical protein